MDVNDSCTQHPLKLSQYGRCLSIILQDLGLMQACSTGDDECYAEVLDYEMVSSAFMVPNPSCSWYRMLVSSGLSYEDLSDCLQVGNETCLVNDPTVDPLIEGSNETIRPENVTVFEVRVGCW